MKTIRIQGTRFGTGFIWNMFWAKSTWPENAVNLKAFAQLIGVGDDSPGMLFYRCLSLRGKVVFTFFMSTMGDAIVQVGPFIYNRRQASAKRSTQ